MAFYFRDNNPTPNGGVYSEFYFFDDKGNYADADVATRCVIRECDEHGDTINEIWGIANSDDA